MFELTRDQAGAATALATAVCWAFTAILFGAAARRGGSSAMNLLRLLLACAFLGLAVAVTGTAGSMPGGQLGCMLASGVVGLAAGDAAYFRSLQILGPRRAALLMAFAPGFTALLMVPLLGETIGIVGIAGMALTIGGIVWVHNERDDGREIEGSAREGLVLGILGAVGQAVGYVLAKVGLGSAPAGAWLPRVLGLEARSLNDGPWVAGEAVSPLYGTLLRMVAAAAVLLALGIVGRGPQRMREALRDRKFVALTAGGTVVGPVIGVWLSLVAVNLTNTAVAATIIAASPIFVIPVMRVTHGHRASARAWLGAGVAILGVALLSFRAVIREAV